MREILSFRGDYSSSAFPNGINLTNESNTVVTISERKKRHQFESNPLVLRLLFFWVKNNKNAHVISWINYLKRMFMFTAQQVDLPQGHIFLC